MNVIEILRRGVRRWTIIATLVVLGSAPSIADVRIGALYPFSGPLAFLGEDSARGLELAVSEMNANGGLRGEKIVIERGDAVDNNQAIGEARRLISGKVIAIFGTYSSSRALAASQVSELAKVPYFELGSVADEITDRGFKYLFRTGPTAKNLAEAVIGMLQHDIIPKSGKAPTDINIGIVHEDSSFGTAVADHEKRLATAAGLNVVVVQSYPSTTVDMSSLVLDLKARQINVVLPTSYQNDSILFLKQASEAGYKPLAVIGGGGGYSLQATADAVGSAAMDGILVADLPQFLMNPAFGNGRDAFLKSYQLKYSEPPRAGHSMNNYTGALAILKAMNRANSFDADAIVKAVAAIDVPDGSTPPGFGIAFNDKHQNYRAFMVGFQWQGGKLVTVYPAGAAVAPVKLGK